MCTTMKGEGDVIKGDFAVKIFAFTGIRAHNLLTHFFVAAAPPIQA